MENSQHNQDKQSDNENTQEAPKSVFQDQGFFECGYHPLRIFLRSSSCDIKDPEVFFLQNSNPYNITLSADAGYKKSNENILYLQFSARINLTDDNNQIVAVAEKTIAAVIGILPEYSSDLYEKVPENCGPFAKIFKEIAGAAWAEAFISLSKSGITGSPIAPPEHDFSKMEIHAIQ